MVKQKIWLGKKDKEKGGRTGRREREGKKTNTQINTLMTWTASQASACIDTTFVDNSQFLPCPVLIADTSSEYIKLQPNVCLPSHMKLRALCKLILSLKPLKPG